MNNRQTELFWELLANPADKNYTPIQNLRQLVSEYPQSSLLQSLLVYAGDDENQAHAVVYSNPQLLYKVRNDFGRLSAVEDNQLIKTVNEKRFFHTEDISHELPASTAPEQEANTGFITEEIEQQPLVDSYSPAENFFEPERPQEHTAVIPEPEITEPTNLDDLLNYGDEVTTGEHELEHHTTETARPEQKEETIAEPEKLDDLINYGDEVTTGEHELQPPVTEFHHPEQETAPEATAEPVVEQQSITEETQPQPQADLPTLGFYVPGQADTEEESYTGGDISSRLFESYAQSFEHLPQQPIEDEVFDEIVGIDDINVAVPDSFVIPKDEVPQSPQPVEESATPALGFEVPEVNDVSKENPAAASTGNRKVDLTDEAEKLMLSNIAATDFFVFDHALSERIKAGDDIKESVPPPSVQPQAAAPAPQPAAEPQPAKTIAPEQKQTGPKKIEYERVTKYFDEKMPYSFMWWLDKTRKEHSGIYQPFVLDTTQKIEKNVPDELQQQYYENIFQLTSVDDLERATGTQPVLFDNKKKEDEIIERFIHEAPQIKPQTSEKLDNENKAKRSSEDQDEIVSETLAQVYTDQMLYHKAIRVYEKLKLKFPEKRRYFAGQIEQLEKKIS